MIQKVEFDIDIDLADRNLLLDRIQHICATRVEQNQIKKHNSGIYLQNIPSDPRTGWSTLNYKIAQERGYFKFDLLNVGFYKNVKNDCHLQELIEKEPPWELLEEKEFVDLLFHVNGHDSILKIMKPKNIEQLAAVLAMIRPAKRYLIGKDWTTVMKEIWIKPSGDQYYFKKSHSLSYAMAVVVHMNLLIEQLQN
jgi:hypothetical protein